jgi:hypothetical protein
VLLLLAPQPLLLTVEAVAAQRQQVTRAPDGFQRPSLRSRRSPAEPLLPRVGLPLALVGPLLPRIGLLLPRIGLLLPRVGLPLALVGPLLPRSGAWLG